MPQTLTIDLQGVNGPLQQEIIPNLLTQVYPNTYNLSRINITNEFSLIQCVLITNECSMCESKKQKQV